MQVANPCAQTPTPLSRHVASVRAFRPSPGRPHHEIEWLPNGRAWIVFRLTRGSPSSARAARDADIGVAGPRTHALFKTTVAVPLAIAVELAPGCARRVIGAPPSELADRIVRLEDLWGRDAASLCEALVGSRGEGEMITALVGALADRAARGTEPASAELARRAVRVFGRAQRPPRVGAVAKELGVTPRHLRRAFLDDVGVTPQLFARGLRLERALRQIHARGPGGRDRDGVTDWARIAAEAGYCDQAHMIGEFRTLVGTTPGAFLRGRAWGLCPPAAAGA